MSEPRQGNYEGWAIVEMMGHQKEIGFVTTEAYGQAVLFRVDVPELPAREETLRRAEWDGTSYLPAGAKVKREAVPGRSRLIAPASLYALNPCTEEAARAALEQTISRPLMLLELPAGTKALPMPADEETDEDEDDFEPDFEEEDAVR